MRSDSIGMHNLTPEELKKPPKALA
jgi:hypothetical protein